MDFHTHYKNDAVATATPAILVTMLYDRALQGVSVARRALEVGDQVSNELANRELIHTQRVLNELQVTLDHDRGGEIAASLSSLYSWCLEQLITANLTKSGDPLASVEDVLSQLRDAWTEAMASLNEAAPSRS